VIIAVYQNNSLDYKRQKYQESKQTEFKGKITAKKKMEIILEPQDL